MESDRKVENFEVVAKMKSDEIKPSNQTNGGQVIHQIDKENDNPNKENSEQNIRRHDEPSELSFEICKRKIGKVLLLFYWIDESIFLHERIAC